MLAEHAGEGIDRHRWPALRPLTAACTSFMSCSDSMQIPDKKVRGQQRLGLEP